MSQQNDVISIAHKVEILPDQEAILHFRRAFGCARFAYNWGLTKWQEYYQQGIKMYYLKTCPVFLSST